jgi:CHAT domain-containing protein/Tfp pilus assembly protein PilF
MNFPLTYLRVLFTVLVFLYLFSAPPVQSQSGDSSLEDLFESAVEYYINAEYETAYAIFEELTELYNNERQWEKLVDVLTYKSTIKRNNRDFEESAKLISRTEQILENYIDKGHILYTALYNSKAYNADIHLDLDKALEWALKSVELAENHQNEYMRKVRAYATLGYIQDSRGDYRAAIEAHKRGAEISDRITDERDHYYSKTLVYNNLGVAYRKAGEPQKAMQYYEKNRVFLEKLFHDEHPEIAMNYNNVGAIHYVAGDFARAAQYFVRTANIMEKNYGRNHQNVAAAYNNAGTSYFQLKELEEAIRYLEMAQEIKIHVLGENHLDTAIGHSNLAAIYKNREEFDSALSNYNRSLEIRRNNYGNDHPNLVNPYLQRSKLYLAMEQPYRALSDIREVLNIARYKLGEFHPHVAETFILSGDAHRAINEYEAALGNYQQALIRLADGFEDTDVFVNPHKLETSHPVLLLGALSSKADLMNDYYLLKRDKLILETANETFKLAIKLIEELQMNYQHEASKLNLLGENFSIFEGAMVSAYNLYRLTGKGIYLDELFTIIEQSKARIASELLQETEAREFAGVPGDVLEQERINNASIAGLHQKLTLEKEKGEDQDMQKVRELQDRLFDAHAVQQEFINMLEEEFPAYFEMKYLREIPALEVVQQQLVEEDQIVLNYLVGDEHTFVMAISRNDVSIYKLAIEENLPDTVGKLRASINKRDASAFRKTAAGLYDQLLRPVEERIAGYSHLLIIPNHVLHYLPFELLLKEPAETDRADTWSYLIRDYHVSYAPSMMVYGNMRNNGNFNANNLLALAPYIDRPYEYSGEAGMRDYTAGLSPLPITRYETEEIANIFKSQRRFWNVLSPRQNVTLLQNQDASIRSLNNLNLKNYGYLHFATHAFIHESSPSLSGILLADDGDGEKIIYLDDIYNLQLNADLVVLSACDTGIGSIARGEGIIGFNRAFIHSGAQNLLVSLWKVGDRNTSELMIRFYREMFGGAGKAEALRTAKLSLIDRPDTAFPSEWASFVLIGR